MRSYPGWASIVAIALAVNLRADAKIRPDFTPIQLCDQSDQVLVVKLKDKSDDKPTFEIVKALKGTAPAGISIDLTQTQPEPRDEVRKLLKAHGEEAGLLFAGTINHESKGYLSLHGTWMELADGADGKWLLAVIANDTMNATWNGGTDMLERCVRYVIDNPGSAFIPVEAGAAWRGINKVGAVGDKPTAIAAVDLAGDGKLAIFVGSAKGDRLFRATNDGGQDVTESTGLASKSACAAWGDFNGDGKADLASYDGKELTIWTQGADGKFAASKSGVDLKGAKVIGISPVQLPKWSRPGIAVTVSGEFPMFLVPLDNGAFGGMPMDVETTHKPAPTAACLVADFDGDGVPDVLEIDKDASLLWRGKDDAFELQAPGAVSTGASDGQASLADFDGDGALDVLVTSSAGVRLYQNDGKGKFEESIDASGEAGSKASPTAIWGCACEFNNDGHQDLLVLAADRGVRMWFNRGFRSFGEAPKLEQSFAAVPNLNASLAMAMPGDFIGDGAQSVAIALGNGEVWLAANDAGGPSALSVSVRLAPKTAGPVVASLWKERRCLGAVNVSAANDGFLGIPDAGPYAIKWTIPSKPATSKAIVVDHKMSVTIQ